MVQPGKDRNNRDNLTCRYTRNSSGGGKGCESDKLFIDLDPRYRNGMNYDPFRTQLNFSQKEYFENGLNDKYAMHRFTVS